MSRFLLPAVSSPFYADRYISQSEKPGARIFESRKSASWAMAVWRCVRWSIRLDTEHPAERRIPGWTNRKAGLAY
ncbi:MAG: hypothetical protein IKX20_09380 [Paludibacteraceae bacterium]|nr:hypothetical protein [Paludibacteraceae bacterium]